MNARKCKMLYCRHHQKKHPHSRPHTVFSQYLVINLNQAPQLRVLIALVPSFSDKMLEFNN